MTRCVTDVTGIQLIGVTRAPVPRYPGDMSHLSRGACPQEQQPGPAIHADARLTWEAQTAPAGVTADQLSGQAILTRSAPILAVKPLARMLLSAAIEGPT
jgi:hypothetical protein